MDDIFVDDRELERLGEMFVRRRIGWLLGISFERFLRLPILYASMADAVEAALERGDGLNVVDGHAAIVPLAG